MAGYIINTLKKAQGIMYILFVSIEYYVFLQLRVKSVSINLNENKTYMQVLGETDLHQDKSGLHIFFAHYTYETLKHIKCPKSVSDRKLG